MATRKNKRKKQNKRSPNKAVMVMVGYYPGGCDVSIPVHACDPCEDREYGRIRSAGFIHKDFSFTDPTNELEWQTGINERKILVIPATNGEMSEPSEKTGPGYGDTTETLTGFDFTAKYADPNFKSNCDFYTSLVGNRNFLFFFRTSSQTFITDKTVTIIPKFKVDNDLTSEVVWNVTVKWMSSKFPCPFQTPGTILESCYIPDTE